MEYKEMWKWLRENRAALVCAEEFFSGSPTGQYDEEACTAIAVILSQMERDDWITNQHSEVNDANKA